jgi:hypothetical protein
MEAADWTINNPVSRLRLMNIRQLAAIATGKRSRRIGAFRGRR